jgi:hypothetical protein
MIHVDDSRWPIVEVSRRGALTMADVSAQQIACGSLLDRHQPFVFLFTFAPQDAPGAVEPGAHAFATRWLSVISPVLEVWCRGCALLGAAPHPEPLVDALTEGGCPVASFPDARGAESWLADCLSTPPTRRLPEAPPRDEDSS